MHIIYYNIYFGVKKHMYSVKELKCIGIGKYITCTSLFF